MLKTYSETEANGRLVSDCRCYNLHDLLSVQIVRKEGTPRVNRHFADLKFAYFGRPGDDRADIRLEIGAFNPQNQRCQVVDNKFWVKENYIYYKGSLSAGIKHAEIIGFETGDTVLRCEAAVTGVKSFFTQDLLVQNVLLLPLLKYKLAQKGWVLLHGGGVAKAGEGLLILGANDSFKTRIALDLVSRGGYELLGDDLILVRDSQMLACPEHLRILDFRYRQIRAGAKASAREKLRFLFSLLKPPSDPAPAAVPICSSASIEAAVLLLRTNRSRVALTALDDHEALARTVESNEELETAKLVRKYIHIENFAKYLFAYTYVFPKNRWSEYQQQRYNEVKKTLRNKPKFCLEIPYRYSPEALHALQNVLISERPAFN